MQFFNDHEVRYNDRELRQQHANDEQNVKQALAPELKPGQNERGKPPEERDAEHDGTGDEQAVRETAQDVKVAVFVQLDVINEAEAVRQAERVGQNFVGRLKAAQQHPQQRDDGRARPSDQQHIYDRSAGVAAGAALLPDIFRDG